MHIKVDKLKEEVKKYNDLISRYEDCKIKLYNEYGYISNMWNDGNTPKFFDNVDSERISSELAISNMKSVVDVYNYIVENYEKIGNEINVQLNLVQTLNSKFNKCISDCDTLIKIFDQMSLKDIPEGYWYTNKRTDICNIKKRITGLKNKINGILNDISDIEAEAKSRISNINIDIIKKGDFDI